MKCILLVLVFISLHLSAQDWEKVNDYMGLDSYSSYFPLVGTNDGLVERISQGYNDWRHLGMRGHKILAVLPVSNGVADTIIVGTEDGVYFTPDYGLNWKKANIPTLRCNEIVNVQSYDYRYFALTSSGVYSSRTGVDWTLYALAGKDVKSYEVGGHFNSIFGFVCADDYYYTDDYGVSFKTVGLSLENEELLDLAIYATNVGQHTTWVSLASQKGIYVIRMDSMYFSDNPQWQIYKEGLEDCTIKWFTTTGQNYTLLTDQGVYTSNDSANTFVHNEYSLKGRFTNGRYMPSAYNRPAFTVYTSEGYGLFYNSEPIGFSNIQDIELAFDGTIFIATNGFGVYKSVNEGVNWIECNQGLGNLEVRDLAFTKGGVLYAATRSGAYLSDDMGKNWTSVKPELLALHCLLTDGYPDDGLMHFVSGKSTFYWLGSNFNWNGGASIGVDNLNDEIYTIVYQRNKEKYWAGGKYGLWSSNTDYVDWRRNQNFPSYSIFDIDIDSKNRLLAVTKAYVYYSDDDGVSWHKLAGIPKQDLKDILIDDKDNYYVATDGGVYYSTDRGLSWEEMNDGLLNLPYRVKIDCIALDAKGHLWAGSTVSGLYRSTKAVASPSNIRQQESLNKQSLYYDSKSRLLKGIEIYNNEIVDISIFTLDGRQLIYEKVKTNTIPLDLNSGVYVVMLSSSDSHFTQKLSVK